MTTGEKTVLDAYIKNTRSVEKHGIVRRNNRLYPQESDQRQGKTSLEMSSHDGAVIATVRCVIPGIYETAVDSLKTVMNLIAVQIEEQGGLIGHIKAFVKEENRSCLISVPEAGDLQIKESLSPSVYVECVHIIFGLSFTELEKVVYNGFAEWLEEK